MSDTEKMDGDQAFDKALSELAHEYPEPEDDAPVEPDEPDETEAPPAPTPEVSREPAVTPEDAAMVKRYGEFLRDLERNKDLREHVLAFWEKPKDAPRTPEVDPLEKYQDEDRTALSQFGSKLKTEVLEAVKEMLGETIAPLKDMWAEHAADREMQALEKEYPRWREWADPKDLADIRSKMPGLSALAAFLLVGGKKALANAAKADKQMAKVGEVLARKHPAEATPRRHVKVDKREVSFDEAFDRAYSEMKAAVGEPRR